MTPDCPAALTRVPTPLIIVGGTSVLRNPRVFGTRCWSAVSEVTTDRPLHTFSLELPRNPLQGAVEGEAHPKLISSVCLRLYRHPPERRSFQERNVPQPGPMRKDNHHMSIPLVEIELIHQASVHLIHPLTPVTPVLPDPKRQDK